HRVVGVLPDTFLFPNRPQLWIPLDEGHWGGSADGSAPGVELFAVLRQDASPAAAEERVRALAASHVASAGGAGGPGPSFRVLGYTEPSQRAEVWAGTGGLLAALLLVLTVIATQVGHLFAVRNAGRARELAMRTALGARRGQVVAQLGWEVGVLVAMAAGVAAVGAHRALAWIGGQLDEAPFWLRLEPGPGAFAALMGAALLVVWTAGVAPAIRATRRVAPPGLYRAGRGVDGGAQSPRPAMAVFEMAVAIALFAAALGLGRGAVQHLALPELLPEGEILTSHLRLPSAEQPAGDSVPDAASLDWRRAAYRGHVDALRRDFDAIPGVTAVGFTDSLPGEAASTERILIEPGPDGGEPAPPALAPTASVDVGFFAALGARPLAGRLLEARDLGADAAPVAVVDRSFADRFGGGSPVGRRLRWLDDDGTPSEAYEVVGVVPDLGLSLTSPGGVYFPWRGGRTVDVVLRVGGEPMAYAGAVRKAVGDHAADATVRRLQPLDAVARGAATTLGAVSGAAVLAGGSALVLSWLGLFAVAALRVTERRREIGVRRALGARDAHIVGWLGRITSIHVLAGSALGALGYGLLQRASAAAELGLQGAPWDLPLVVAIFAGGAAVAAGGPALRALRIQPARALGSE
ncbi:MAG: FtsX-like permease family protein, partial [Acidobacteriota bacterium]